MKNRFIKIGAVFCTAAIVSSLLSGCTYRPETATVTEKQQPLEEITEEQKPQGQLWTVTYRLDGDILASEQVSDGNRPTSVPTVSGDQCIVSWNNANGTRTDVLTNSITADTEYQAVLGPKLNRQSAFMQPCSDGLFHPADSFTKSDAVCAVYAMLAEKPSGETFLKDVTTRAKCYTAATTLVTAGYIALDSESKFYPDKAITSAELSELLGHIFAPSSVAMAMENCSDSLTRGEAAQVMVTLLDPSESSNKPYYPDVRPTSEFYTVVETAGIPSNVDFGEKSGFYNLDGYLYYFDDSGYFLCDQMVGTLYFDESGRYTSGREELDTWVADIIRGQTTESMSRDDMLRSVYEYVRDHYLYLKRNYYDVGETGWEIDEALTLFTTGKGNCYNFTGAFWALARGVGYDAVAFAGLVGVGRDPHSWVEIEYEDATYIFDVETEMSYRLQNDYYTSMYKITMETGEKWSYIRTPEEEAAALAADAAANGTA